MTPILSLPFSFSIKGLADNIATAFVDAAIRFVAGLVRSLMVEVLDVAVPATTTIGLANGEWFASAARLMLPIEELVVAPLLFAATIGAVLRQDMRRLARAWAVGLPLSLVGGFATVSLTRLGLAVTDALSSGIQQQVAPDLKETFLNAVTWGITGGLESTLGAVVGIVVVVGGLAVWLELLLRSAAVELAVFFMPLALAGLVWPATAHWAKRLVEVLAALLLAKPVVVGALCLGASALTSPKASLSSAATGSAILLMAAFAPVALLKLVPIAEASAIGHLQGFSRQPFGAAERAVQRVMAIASSGGAAAGAGAAGGGEAGSASAEQLMSQLGPAGDDGADPLGPARPSGEVAGHEATPGWSARADV